MGCEASNETVNENGEINPIDWVPYRQDHVTAGADASWCVGTIKNYWNPGLDCNFNYWCKHSRSGVVAKLHVLLT